MDFRPRWRAKSVRNCRARKHLRAAPKNSGRSVRSHLIDHGCLEAAEVRARAREITSRRASVGFDQSRRRGRYALTRSAIPTSIRYRQVAYVVGSNGARSCVSIYSRRPTCRVVLATIECHRILSGHDLRSEAAICRFAINRTMPVTALATGTVSIPIASPLARPIRESAAFGPD